MIEKKLLESNQIQLINFPRKSSLRQERDDGKTEKLNYQVQWISVRKVSEFEILQSMIESILNDLDKEGKDINTLGIRVFS